MNWSQVLWAFAAIVGVQAATDLGVLGLGRREAALERWLPFLVSGAAGVLLATACLDLLPDAVRSAGPGLGMWQVLLATLLLLFCLQAWAHAVADAPAAVDGGHAHGHIHAPARGSSARPSALLLGSALHSTVDGVAIMAAFAAGPRAGWSAALAVGLHELPHRMSDFALLVHLGMPKRRAAGLAIAAGAMALAGGLGVALLGHHHASLPWLMPISAATFLYIALADLVPELHANRSGQSIWWQMLCLVAGAALMAGLAHLPGE